MVVYAQARRDDRDCPFRNQTRGPRSARRLPPRRWRRWGLGGLRTIVLAGMAGRDGWPAFAASAEARDGADHPLDRWSRRVIDALARDLGAVALYPFGGPPHWPFQQWARRAEPVHPSPIGILIHPAYGLWHSYRGALGIRRGARRPAARSLAEPLRLVPRALVPGRLSGRRILGRRLRRRRLRRASEEPRGRRLHDGRLPRPARLPGRGRARARARAGRLHHAGVLAGAGGGRCHVPEGRCDGGRRTRPLTVGPRSMNVCVPYFCPANHGEEPPQLFVQIVPHVSYLAS